MKIQWYGMGCFFIESEKKTKILTDPYDDSLGYGLPPQNPDIVTVSHEHFDHNAVDSLSSAPVLIRNTGEFKEGDIKISGIKSFHDENKGRSRGLNTAYRIEVDNISFVHLGDIGHKLDSRQRSGLMPCDILAIPVGGVFTVKVKDAVEIVNELNPLIVIPMHYSTPSCKLPINTEQEFVNAFVEVVRVKHWAGSRSSLPKQTRVLLMKARGEIG